MTLAALERYDPRERAEILADLALATSPRPSDGGTDEGLQAILAEISKKVGVSDAPFTAKAKSLIDEQIANALSAEVLSGRDINEILGRAGNSGRLPTSLYTVEVGAPFRQQFSPFRVSDADVRNCVRHAEDVWHLQLGANNSVSLFAQLVENKEKRDPFWAIAHMHRRGRELHAHCFWRVYPSETDISGARSPVDVLAAFVSECGSLLSINGDKAMFFRGQKVPMPQGAIAFQINADDPKAIMTFSHSGESVGQIILGYAISPRTYREYLLRHHVALREETPDTAAGMRASSAYATLAS